MNNFSNKIDEIRDLINNLNDALKKGNVQKKEDVTEKKIIKSKIQSSTSTSCKQLVDLQYRGKKEKKNIETSNLEEHALDEINILINNEIEKVYNKPWNKLEKCFRLKKINEYIDNLFINHNINNDALNNEIKDELIKMLNNNKINKKSDIDYDKENALIINIKCLIIEPENIDKPFRIKLPIIKKKIQNNNKINNSSQNELLKLKKINSSDSKKIEKINKQHNDIPDI